MASRKKDARAALLEHLNRTEFGENGEVIVPAKMRAKTRRLLAALMRERAAAAATAAIEPGQTAQLNTLSPLSLGVLAQTVRSAVLRGARGRRK